MFGWKRRRKQLIEEFEAHIEDETRDNIDRGMSPERARHEARKTFGSVPLAVEQSREALGFMRLERLLQDISYAVRSLRRVPGYAATLVLTLALGLGCATAMLAVVESVLMRPVPLPHSEQLVDISAREDTHGTHASSHALSYKSIDALSRGNRTLVGISGYVTIARPITAPDGTRISLVTEVTANLFETLEVQTKLGRLIASSDAKSPVAVVSEEFWRDRLHASASAVGSTIQFSGQPYTVIGVLPVAVRFPQAFSGPMVYLPVSLDASGTDSFKMDSASAIARLKPGVTGEQALADMQAVMTHAASGKTGQAATGQAKEGDPDGSVVHLEMRSYRDVVVGDLRKPLIALLGGVGVLLLIACANAANLQIGRAASRLPEMQVRSALGASFGRLLQQLITESVLVALFSALLGGGLSYAAIRMVRHAYGEEFARFDELTIHPVVLLGTAVLAVLVGVVASVAPALNIRRKTSTGANLKNVTRASRLPGMLVALQVALTCVLLVVSGLFVRTLEQLEHVRLGFDPHGVSTLVLIPESPSQQISVTRQEEMRLLHRFESLPGVQAVAMQSDIPFSNYNVDMNGTTDISGRAYQKDDTAHYSFVSTGFVAASGIRLLRGRDFEASDESSGEMGVLVNDAFVKKYLGNRDPIGVTVKFHREPTDTDADMPIRKAMTVVGVVEDELQGGNLGAEFQPMVYVDYLQVPADSMLGPIFNMSAQYAVRSKLPEKVVASELRAAIHEVAPGMTEMSLGLMEEGVADSLAQRRLGLQLVSGFGFVALALSAIGIYGVLAYSVALRRREIGIRMALGSSRPRVARLVLWQAGAMVLLGLLPGIGGAWAAGRAVSSFLFGVSPLDPMTLASVAGILVLVSVVAASLPTLRAAQVDPVETLRAE